MRIAVTEAEPGHVAAPHQTEISPKPGTATRRHPQVHRGAKFGGFRGRDAERQRRARAAFEHGRRSSGVMGAAATDGCEVRPPPPAPPTRAPASRRSARRRRDPRVQPALVVRVEAPGGDRTEVEGGDPARRMSRTSGATRAAPRPGRDGARRRSRIRYPRVRGQRDIMFTCSLERSEACPSAGGRLEDLAGHRVRDDGCERGPAPGSGVPSTTAMLTATRVCRRGSSPCRRWGRRPSSGRSCR